MSWDNFNESTDLKAQIEAFKDSTGSTHNQFMPTKFIAQEKTASSVKTEVLELVVPHWEDHQQMLVKQSKTNNS